MTSLTLKGTYRLEKEPVGTYTLFWDTYVIHTGLTRDTAVAWVDRWAEAKNVQVEWDGDTAKVFAR